MRTACALAALMLMTVAAAAVDMIPISIKQLTERADLVVRGTVSEKSCQRDPAGRVYTRVKLDVTEVLKGARATGPFTVVHGGGVLGVQRSEVSGQVDYQLGEEVIAFLVLNQRGEGVTVGLSQGKFHVWTDPASGAQLARNPFHGGAVTAAAPGSAAQPAAARLRVDDLKRQVTEAGR